MVEQTEGHLGHQAKDSCGSEEKVQRPSSGAFHMGTTPEGAGVIGNRATERRKEGGIRKATPQPTGTLGTEHFTPCFSGTCSPRQMSPPVPTRVPCLLTQGEKQRPSQGLRARWRGWKGTHSLRGSMQLAWGCSSGALGPWGQAHGS